MQQKLINHETYPSEFQTTTEAEKFSEYEEVNLDSEDNIRQEKIKMFYIKQKHGEYSMFTNPAIHPAYRYGIFLCGLLTLTLILWSNLSISASVINYGIFGGLQTQNFFMGQISFLHSLGDMWRGGVYVLAILIGFGSGAWPYMKLCLMGIALFMKEKYLKHRYREILLVILDAAGKWALVDAYVMFILAVGFRYKSEIPVPYMEVEENIVVQPNWGFYSFLMSCLLSLIITHIMLYQHRALRKRPIDPDFKTKPLMPNSRIRRYGVIILLFVTIGFCISGIIANSFNFTFRGLGAYIIPEVDRQTDFSILSVIFSIRKTSYDSNSFGAIFQTILFFTLSIIVSFSFLILLGVILFVPMSLKLQRRLYQMLETIYAWSTFDVMVLTIVVTALETEKFSNFNIGDGCDGINQLIQYVNDSPMPVDIEPPICFQVTSGLNEGMVYLGIAATLFLGQGAITIRLLKSKLDKKIRQYFNEEPYFHEKIDFTQYLIMKSKQASMLQRSHIDEKENEKYLVKESFEKEEAKQHSSE